MIYELIKLEELSGDYCSIYSLKTNNEPNLLEEFIDENRNDYLAEIKDILGRLRIMGKQTGAREQFFKLAEGAFGKGDGVCALYDRPNSKLRLYCIRFGVQTLIVGSGGNKPKSIRAFQENITLKKSNYLLRSLSIEIINMIKSGEIYFSRNGNDFQGNLYINI